MHMKALTVQEIVEYAIKIEQESFTFYQSAAETIIDERALKIIHVLADEEMTHINRLRELLHMPKTTSLEMVKVATVEGIHFINMIPTNPISKSASRQEILREALAREKKTRDLYKRMVEMATMSPPVQDTFQALEEQEQQHVIRVEALIGETE